MANELASAVHSRTTWISEERWHELLAESARIRDQIRIAELGDLPTEALWRQLRPIAEEIRSPHVKVRGIDDLTTVQRREKVFKERGLA